MGLGLMEVSHTQRPSHFRKHSLAARTFGAHRTEPCEIKLTGHTANVLPWTRWACKRVSLSITQRIYSLNLTKLAKTSVVIRAFYSTLLRMRVEAFISS